MRKGNIYIIDMWVKNEQGKQASSKTVNKKKTHSDMDIDALQDDEQEWYTQNAKGRNRKVHFQRQEW